jgi:hypothetical protein
MDAAQLSAAIRKPLVSEVVHYVSDPGETCTAAEIIAVDTRDDIFLDLRTTTAPALSRVMLDQRFGYWGDEFKSYRQGTWHWPCADD